MSRHHYTPRVEPGVTVCRLLVVLAVEEARDVDRLALVARVFAFVDLSPWARPRAMFDMRSNKVPPSRSRRSGSSSAGGAIGGSPTGLVRMSSAPEQQFVARIVGKVERRVGRDRRASSFDGRRRGRGSGREGRRGGGGAGGREGEHLGRLRRDIAGLGLDPGRDDRDADLAARSLLNAEPQMMLASGSTSSLMWLAASSTSIRRMSSPPVIEMITPLAPFMLTAVEQRIGDRLLRRLDRAIVARSASPVPIIALPISLITERTSAKSRLIRPGMTIRSVIPRTPCCSTSSAISNASLKVVFGVGDAGTDSGWG